LLSDHQLEHVLRGRVRGRVSPPREHVHAGRRVERYAVDAVVAGFAGRTPRRSSGVSCGART
jgi:hypothetical protein